MSTISTLSKINLNSNVFEEQSLGKNDWCKRNTNRKSQLCLWKHYTSLGALLEWTLNTITKIKLNMNINTNTIILLKHKHECDNSSSYQCLHCWPFVRGGSDNPPLRSSESNIKYFSISLSEPIKIYLITFREDFQFRNRWIFRKGSKGGGGLFLLKKSSLNCFLPVQTLYISHKVAIKENCGGSVLRTVFFMHWYLLWHTHTQKINPECESIFSLRL